MPTMGPPSWFLRFAADCPGDSPAAVAARHLRHFGEAFPGTLEAVDASGLNLYVGPYMPGTCTEASVLPGPATDAEERPAALVAVGLFCGVERYAWASSEHPQVVVWEMMHALDQQYLIRSGVRKSEADREALVAEYGAAAVSRYGITYTSVDPEWMRLWRDYAQKTDPDGKFASNCRLSFGDLPTPAMGCQGITEPIELFMEIGGHYADGLMEDYQTPVLGGLRRLFNGQVNQPDWLRGEYPELVDYFLRIMGSFAPQTGTASASQDAPDAG